ncbi:bifunctional protein-serine/threonine kinase/phosphatase [Nitratifractor sp.]|uniref:bifunctional protein-serine/threonine kinase/phosphatase n=1 Tax=Nitratifractor sp. TaxID=2268144 RepID=UPI0025D8FB09|nr:bifunctional protein-serine/threonine kinase/phosphatase [Nitratifractor sp.]
MSTNRFKTSSFGLAKGHEALSDDYAAVRVMEDGLCIGVLCDGVGSARAGGTAARRTVNYLMNNFKTRPRSWSIEKSLRHFIANINEILYREGMEEYEDPEYVTTLSVVVIEDNRLYGANVGDSPIWLQREGELLRLSIPHSSDEKGMEHVLTQAIGLSETVDPYLFENNLRPGDRLLLASDGLEAVLDEQEIAQRVPGGATALIKYASKQVKDDLPDDTTALVIEVLAESKTCRLKKIDLPIPARLKKGEVIDGYRLLRPLIANERTWLTEKKGVRYVLKFPSAEAIDDEAHLDLFVREAWNAARLKAGFFPKAVIPRNRTVRYYVMEYLEGPTLKEVIAKKPLSVEDAIQLGKFLLNACSYLLKYDLVHGDIKPENIVVLERRGKRVYKLIDFGSIVEIFSIASRAGTPSYLAPERFAGDPISEQSEIFAIGVTLYEALSRKYPYGEIEPFQNPTFKTPQPLRRLNPIVPAWLESVVMRAVEKEKDRRYAHYSEMEYELTHPEKVLPYYPENATLLEREPVKVYRWAFTASLIVNVILLILLLR